LLVSEGIITEKEQDGRFAKTPTEKGVEQGIRVIDKVSEKGNPYTVLMYPVSIQRMLVEHYIKTAVEETFEEVEEMSECAWLSDKR